MVMVSLSQQNMKKKVKEQHQHISDAGVRDLITQGNFDEAVDLYRRFTGVDLFTAKTAVQDIQTEMRLGTSITEIQRLLRLGDKAGAIETYQQATGLPLAEALAAIEAMEQQKGR